MAIGHCSPVAAHDPAGDRVLLLDVTPGFGAQLIPSERLRAAMNTRDPVSGRRRGRAPDRCGGAPAGRTP
ncbi:MAG: phytochelatin synthase family protein [Desulfomicrobium escambiense]|nr:phytochelatin synthase family protein [Desulfomicrobium escambiense]